MVQLYIANTDWGWFDYLRSQAAADEVNFWRPGGTGKFRALTPGELFLFRLKAPRNVIGGGGFFFRSTVVPISLAWEAFEWKNGHGKFEEMRTSLMRMRTRLGISAKGVDEREDFQIGCVILTQPFFWPDRLWISVPDSWAPQIQKGKGYSTSEQEGMEIWRAVQDRIEQSAAPVLPGLTEPSFPRYGDPIVITPRLGQGAFRIAVTDAYQRRCVVTGERTLPALEAAHIRPFSAGGGHDIKNGLLFRRDIHALFDRGYVTVAPDGRFEVSSRIKAEFENGRDYYAMRGRRIAEPSDSIFKPSSAFLEWHNSEVYRE